MWCRACNAVSHHHCWASLKDKRGKRDEKGLREKKRRLVHERSLKNEGEYAV